jgi:GT2 family glycosyltransferase
MKISIIIINYHTSEYVRNCILSVINCVNRPELEFIIVNNDPSDSTLNDVLKDLPQTSLIESRHNIGFGAANNLAVKNTDSEYVAFINPDTLLIEDFLSPIIEFISQNRFAGACAPMLLYENGGYQNSSGFRMGPFYEILEAFMIIPLYREIAAKRYLKITGTEKFHKVGWLSGACMIMKRKVFVEVGGFDESFFLNYEDIDLCRRLEDKGYENFYFPDLRCTHLDHRSFDVNYEFLVFTRYQSRKIYASNHYSRFTRIIVHLAHILGLLLRLILVNFKYKNVELSGRRAGYLKSLKLFLGIKN